MYEALLVLAAICADPQVELNLSVAGKLHEQGNTIKQQQLVQERINSELRALHDRIVNDSQRLNDCIRCIEKLIRDFELAGIDRSQIKTEVEKLKKEIADNNKNNAQDLKTLSETTKKILNAINTLGPEIQKSDKVVIRGQNPQAVPQRALGITVSGLCPGGHLKVSSVNQGKMAEQLGIIAGDCIESVNGINVKSAEELLSALQQTQTVAVYFWRGGGRFVNYAAFPQ